MLNEWIIKTGLPIVSFFGGIGSMLAINYYNTQVAHNISVGIFWFLGMGASIIMVSMGIIGWLFWRN